MNKKIFMELSEDTLLNVDGGSTLGNAMILAGGVVLAFSTGPVGLGVGLACGVLGFCDSQDW